MGRPPTYQAPDAVRAARRVFWERGYEGASVPELERATGLARSSLYHAFGSKRGLFDAALDSYLDEVVRPRLRPLLPCDDAPVEPDALATYLRGLRSALDDGGGPSHGCLLLSTATTPLGDDDAVRRATTAYRRELRAAVVAGLGAAHPEAPPAQAAVLAESVTALVVAALALVRADPAAARDCLDAALTSATPG